MRVPFAEQGLVVMQLPAGRELHTLLMHTSGQWVRAKIPIMLTDDDVQGFASGLTSARRLTLMAVFSLAGEDDDDGNTAAGNEAIPIGDARAAAVRTLTSEDVHPLIELARGATDPVAGEHLMRRWMATITELWAIKRSPEIEAQQLWGALAGEVSGALHRIFGDHVGGAWKSLALATEPSHLDAISERWVARWADTFAALYRNHPACAELVDRFRASVERRVRGDAEREHALDSERAAMAEGAREGAAAQRAAPEAQSVRPPPLAITKPDFWFAVRDDMGDVASDEVSDAAIWADTFLNVMHASNLGSTALDNLMQHNADAIAAIMDTPVGPTLRAAIADASVGTLSAAHGVASAGSRTIVIPKDGPLDLLAYLDQVRVSLAAAHDVAAMVAWERDNAPVYKGDPRIQGKVQLLVLQAVAARRRELGIHLAPAAPA